MDTDVIKRAMMVVLSSEDYVWMDDSFIHNTEVTVAGTTFARTIEVINSHSITLEDTSLAYSVRMINSNNNMFDIENSIMNPTPLVTVVSTNSAGLVVTGSAVLPGDVADIADAVWDEVLTGATHNVNQSSGKQLRQLSEALVATEGSVNDASASTTQFDSDLTNVDGFWNDTVLVFIDGDLQGQARTVDAFLNANGNFSFDAVDGWTSAPANGTNFLLLATHVHPISQITDGIWDEPVSTHTIAGSFGDFVQNKLLTVAKWIGLK
jgi:hypothetical protein